MATDPRLMDDNKLLAWHCRVHALAGRRLSDRQRSLVTLHHELARVAMAERFGATHFRDAHDTPMNHDSLSDRAQAALLLYERHTLCDASHEQRQQFLDNLLYYFH